jgi:hypothetical protein
MRVLSLGLLFVVALPTVQADQSVWKLDLRERAERRADPTENAARQAAWSANGRSVRSEENVVDGSFDPTVLAPIELIDQVIPVFNLERERQEKFRREWKSRGASQLLGKDYWDQLRVVLAPAITVEQENRRIGTLPPSEHTAVMQARHEQFADGGECAARARALTAARAVWGDAFDRFLYEVVAPGVSFSSSCSDPMLMASPEFWLTEWHLMEEGCP